MVKKVQKVTDDEFDLGPDTRASSSSGAADNQVQYLFVGLATALVPVFIFQFLLNMPFSIGYNAIVYGAGTVFCAVILSIAYRSVAVSLANKLAGSKEMDITSSMVRQEAAAAGVSASELAIKKKKDMQAVLIQESTMYSFFLNNLWFVAASMFLGFIVFGRMSAPFGYLFTSSLAAVITSVFATKHNA